MSLPLCQRGRGEIRAYQGEGGVGAGEMICDRGLLEGKPEPPCAGSAGCHYSSWLAEGPSWGCN